VDIQKNRAAEQINVRGQLNEEIEFAMRRFPRAWKTGNDFGQT